MLMVTIMAMQMLVKFGMMNAVIISIAMLQNAFFYDSLIICNAIKVLMMVMMLLLLMTSRTVM